jgi:hypothetical protein
MRCREAPGAATLQWQDLPVALTGRSAWKGQAAELVKECLHGIRLKHEALVPAELCSPKVQAERGSDANGHRDSPQCEVTVGAPCPV